MQSEVKDKAKHGIETADHKVDEGVDAIEKSRVGKSLPTHIEKIEFRDIVYGLLFLIVILTIPVYLLISAYIELKKGTMVGKICYYSIIFTGIVGIAFDAVVVMMRKQVMLKISMIIKALKALTIVLMMFILSAGGTLAKCLQIVYLLGVIVIDAVFLYYAAIYFRRLDSNEYDDAGKSIKNQR